jgi:hypothetical protein
MFNTDKASTTATSSAQYPAIVPGTFASRDVLYCSDSAPTHPPLLCLAEVTEGVVLSAAECRAIAKQKLAQAAHDDRHRRRLTYAAEAWLLLASKLSGEVTAFSTDGIATKSHSKRLAKFGHRHAIGK